MERFLKTVPNTVSLYALNQDFFHLRSVSTPVVCKFTCNMNFIGSGSDGGHLASHLIHRLDSLGGRH